MDPDTDDVTTSKESTEDNPKNGMYASREYKPRGYQPTYREFQPKKTRYNELGRKPDRPKPEPRLLPKRERVYRPMKKYYQIEKCYAVPMGLEYRVKNYKYRPYRPGPHQPTYRQRPLRPIDHSMAKKTYRMREYYRLTAVNYGYAFGDREPPVSQEEQLAATLPSHRSKTSSTHRSVATLEQVRVQDAAEPGYVPAGGVAVLPPVLTATKPQAARDPASRPQPAPRSRPKPEKPTTDLSTFRRDNNGMYIAREYQYMERRFRWDKYPKYREYCYRDPNYTLLYLAGRPIGHRIEKRQFERQFAPQPKPQKPKRAAPKPVVATAPVPAATAAAPRSPTPPFEEEEEVDDGPEPVPMVTAAVATMPATPREVYRKPVQEDPWYPPEEPRQLQPPTPVAASPEPKVNSRTPSPAPRSATGVNSAAIAGAALGGAAVGAVGATAAVAAAKSTKAPIPKPRRKTPSPQPPSPPSPQPVVAVPVAAAATGVVAGAAAGVGASSAQTPPKTNSTPNAASTPASNTNNSNKAVAAAVAVAGGAVVGASAKTTQPPPKQPSPKQQPPPKQPSHKQQPPLLVPQQKPPPPPPTPQQPPPAAPQQPPPAAPPKPQPRKPPSPEIPVAAAFAAPAAAAAASSRPPPAPAARPPPAPAQNPGSGMTGALGSITRSIKIFG